MRTLFAFLVAALVPASTRADDNRPPNFVIILADDLGYGDLGCFGSDAIATPRIDRMARQGARLTDFYTAAPFCSPSRAALLTGRQPARCGVPYVLFPAEHHGLPEDEVTIAELLRTRGYATACIGKWHLGWDTPFRPARHGFDEFFGLPYSNDSNEWPVGSPFLQVHGLEPLPLVDGETVVEAPVDQATLTRRYTERALDFVERHRDRPFLLYLPHTMPHIPQHASAAFEGRSRDGLYGDCVEELDWSIGVLLDALHDLGIARKTLVIVTSDNGAVVRRALPNPNERFPGRSWGGSNVPLRGGKGMTFEGGIRVPAVAWWPGTIEPGRLIDAPVSMMDIFPTLATLAGVSLPVGRVIDGTDRSDLLLGRGREAEGGAWPLYHYFGVQLQAIRDGRWKLFVSIDGPPEPRPISLWYDHVPGLLERQHRRWPRPTLYDLAADPGETTDVSADHPEVVERLTNLARAFDARFRPQIHPYQVAPGPDPPEPGRIREDDDLSAWATDRR